MIVREAGGCQAFYRYHQPAGGYATDPRPSNCSSLIHSCFFFFSTNVHGGTTRGGSLLSRGASDGQREASKPNWTCGQVQGLRAQMLEPALWVRTLSLPISS